MMMRCSKETHDELFKHFQTKELNIEEAGILINNFRKRYPTIANLWKDLTTNKLTYRYNYETGYWRRVL